MGYPPDSSAHPGGVQRLESVSARVRAAPESAWGTLVPDHFRGVGMQGTPRDPDAQLLFNARLGRPSAPCSASPSAEHGLVPTTKTCRGLSFRASLVTLCSLGLPLSGCPGVGRFGDSTSRGTTRTSS